jgi:hypothetical protein
MNPHIQNSPHNANYRPPFMQSPLLRIVGDGKPRLPLPILDALPSLEPMPQWTIDEREIDAMRDAYRKTGGIARGDDLARWMKESGSGDILHLAKLLVSGVIFSFDWRSTFWVPMFQFDLGDLSIRQAPRRVIAQLGSSFDGWAISTWFSQPNSRLKGRRPVDLLESNLPQVLESARIDRFIAAG